VNTRNINVYVFGIFTVFAIVSWTIRSQPRGLDENDLCRRGAQSQPPVPSTDCSPATAACPVNLVAGVPTNPSGTFPAGNCGLSGAWGSACGGIPQPSVCHQPGRNITTFTCIASSGWWNTPCTLTPGGAGAACNEWRARCWWNGSCDYVNAGLSNTCGLSDRCTG
jgi:hypothetical protein